MTTIITQPTFDPNVTAWEEAGDAKSVSFSLGDPTADLTAMAFKFPANGRVTGGYVVDNLGLATGTTNHYTVQLINGGAAGAGTAAITEALRGTSGWVAGQLYAFSTVTGANAVFAAGDICNVKYDETGTVAQSVQVTIQYRIK